MVDAMRAMLDELMGKERDLPPEERTGKGITYKDPLICKYALAGLCPYGLFKNTKSDLGLCKYEVHEDDVEFPPAKEEWDALPDATKERYGYRKELLGVLSQLVRDMERKIERQRERAAKESENRIPSPPEQSQLDELKKQEKEALKRSEEAAEAGNVDASMSAANEAEALSKQQAKLLEQFTTPERTMTVCEVCGVFINSSDNDARKADHLAGKQYMGWMAIREKLKEFQKDEEKRRAEGSSQPSRDREDGQLPDRHRERERGDRGREDDRGRRREEKGSRGDRERSDRHRSDREPRERRRSRSRDRAMRGNEVPPPSHLYGSSRHGRNRERDRR